jgi:6-phosphogluconate dehydrogenase
MRAYERRPDLPNLLLDDTFREAIGNGHEAWRRATTYAQTNGIPIPAFAASLAYFDSYRTANLPQNLTQAQRDFFGAHTYQRSDRGEGSGFVHSEWDGGGVVEV